MINSKLAIFDTFKTKNELTGEARRQRFIISQLATESSPAARTRTAISQKVAKEQGIAWKNIYSGIFHDLDQVLLPLKIAAEEGRLPLKRGPKALQEKGIPYYQLTQVGLALALSLNEVPDKDRILKQFLSELKPSEKDIHSAIQRMAEVSPRFVYSLFEKYAKAYCNGRIDTLIPFSLVNMKKAVDDSISIQAEMLDGFTKLTRPEREKALGFLKSLS